MTRQAAPSPLAIGTGDLIYPEDRVKTDTDSFVRVALSTRFAVPGEADAAPVRPGREPMIALGADSTATIRSGQVVLESGDAIYAAPIIPVTALLVIQTDNATARGANGMSVSADPRLPQVADGSFVTLTIVCGGFTPTTTATGPDGPSVPLKFGQCVQFLEDTNREN